MKQEERDSFESGKTVLTGYSGQNFSKVAANEESFKEVVTLKAFLVCKKA